MENGNCKNGLLRMALIASMALLLAFTAACGESECADDERLVDLGDSEQCLLICDSDEDCQGNDTCHSSQNVCIPGDDDNQDNQNQDNQNQDNQNQNNQNQEDRLTGQALAQAYCELFLGCLDNCGVSGSEAVPNCTANLTPDAQSDPESLWNFVYGDWSDLSGDSIQLKDEVNTCSDVEFVHCGELGLDSHCGFCEAPTTVGDVCSASDDCDSGSLLAAECLGERDQTTNELIGDGICAAYICYTPEGAQVGDVNLTGGCGAGNGCMEVPSGQSTIGICVDVCDSNADCGDDFACQIMGNLWESDWMTENPQPTGVARTCESQCTDNDDCGDGNRCNDEGICELPCGDEGEGDAICDALGGECVDHDGEEFCALD